MSELLKFVCPHCGEETYVEERIEPVVQWNSIDMYANGDYETTFEDSDDWEENPDKTFRYLCASCNADLIPESTGPHAARRKLYEFLKGLDCNKEE